MLVKATIPATIVEASKAEALRPGAAPLLLDEPVAEQRANVADLEVPITPVAPGNVWLALGKIRFVLV